MKRAAAMEKAVIRKKYVAELTFGSKLTVDENRKAALPSLKTTAYPPMSGEYAILDT